jgi:hypothetical protein
MKNLKPALILILIGFFTIATNNIMAQSQSIDINAFNPDGTPTATQLEQAKLDADATEAELMKKETDEAPMKEKKAEEERMKEATSPNPTICTDPPASSLIKTQKKDPYKQ